MFRNNKVLNDRHSYKFGLRNRATILKTVTSQGHFLSRLPYKSVYLYGTMRTVQTIGRFEGKNDFNSEYSGRKFHWFNKRFFQEGRNFLLTVNNISVSPQSFLTQLSKRKSVHSINQTCFLKTVLL